MQPPSRRTLPFAAGLAVCVLLSGGRLRAQESPDAPRYGSTPEELVPYRSGGEPERRFFTSAPEFRGPREQAVDPGGLEEVPILVLAPAGGQDSALGDRMRQGVTLALEDANRDGGFAPGLPFVARYADENKSWGAAANTVVDAVAGADRVWGIVGALEDSNSHVMARVLLKVEVPMVNTGGSDPTLTEHAIPWIVRVRPDDRQNCYRLARRIFETDGHQRVVVFRSNDRYGRVGTAEFVDAARRLHHPIVLEMRFENADAEWSAQIERIRGVNADAVLLWGRAAPCGRALRALRAAGLDQPVYGSDRLCDAEFLEAAGPAAEGVAFSYPFDPVAAGEAWSEFAKRYDERFGEPPDAVAAYAFEGAAYLLASIREAGLDHAAIRDRLYAVAGWDAVVGPVRFDVTHNNIQGGTLGWIRRGAFVFE